MITQRKVVQYHIQEAKNKYDLAFLPHKGQLLKLFFFLFHHLADDVLNE